MLLGPVRIRNQVVLVVCRHQVLQYSSRLEDFELHAVGCLVGDRRNTSIGINLSKPGLLLLVLEYINRHQLYGVSGSSLGRQKRKCHDSTLYSSPSSSRAMWIFSPLGVPSLYAVILVFVVILNYPSLGHQDLAGVCAAGGFGENF